MAMMGSSGWSSQDHGIHGGNDDDFQQFLDLNSMGAMSDGLQFDFHDFQSPSNGHGMQGPGPQGPMDTQMSGTDAAPVMLSRLDLNLHGQMPPMTSAPSTQPVPSPMMPLTPGDAISDIDAQIHYLQQQKLQQRQRQLEEQHAAYFVQQSHMVPPTPRSLEIQAGNGQFYGQPDQTTPQQHAMYDHFQRMRDQHDMSFTPLVSPAVTPLESHFSMEAQFTVPGAYFSPLTSPALHAQTESTPVYDQRMSSANTSSPGEMDLEAMPAPALPTNSAGDLAKKARKSSAAKSRGKGKVAQSPISKPQRRKTTTTPVMNAQALAELAENAELSRGQLPRQALQQPFQPSAHPTPSSSAAPTDSEDGSISPEALSEMPPPPVPRSRSAKPSPYLQPQPDGGRAARHIPLPGKPSPATPASLMKLPSPKVAKDAAAEHIESFELPESVNAANFPKSQLTPLVTGSPRIQASPASGPAQAKTASFQPLPSPVFAKPASAASTGASPQLAPGPATGTPNPRKTPQLAPRGPKRASVGSVHVSPALLPRISPSIKPLLPGGPTAEDAASRLLATKSNYQNILEGNNVPGVSYPSELSTNLTSKRTSHKIAEQGRRNRINSALQEIATLLPKSVTRDAAAAAAAAGDDDDGDSGDKKDKSGNTPNSKASTVEMAIEYIKQLRKEVAEANKRAEEAEKKLGGLRGAPGGAEVEAAAAAAAT